MSHLVCPTCGMNRAISSYDPANIDLDLKLRTQHGKGRGKGFDYEDTSILGDDEISPMVANRCLQCVKMFIDSRTLSMSDIISFFNITAPPSMGYSSNDYMNKILIHELRNEITKLKKSLRRKNRKQLQENKIKAVLETIHSNEDCNSELTLKNGEIRLIIHELNPFVYSFIRNIFLTWDHEDVKKLSKKIDSTDIYLKYAFFLWNWIRDRNNSHIIPAHELFNFEGFFPLSLY